MLIIRNQCYIRIFSCFHQLLEKIFSMQLKSVPCKVDFFTNTYAVSLLKCCWLNLKVLWRKTKTNQKWIKARSIQSDLKTGKEKERLPDWLKSQSNIKVWLTDKFWLADQVWPDYQVWLTEVIIMSALSLRYKERLRDRESLTIISCYK